MAILELFAGLVPRRMQILSLGDGLEGYYRAIFRVATFESCNFFCEHPPISRPRPSQKLLLRLDVLTFSTRLPYTLPKSCGSL